MKLNKVISTFALAVVFAGVPSRATTVAGTPDNVGPNITPIGVTGGSAMIVGSPADVGTGNCFPWGCAYQGQYQQVYTSSVFSGPLSITDLEFYNTAVDFGATSMNTGNWDIFLSTTAVDWNTITGNFVTNLGPDNTLVFSGNLAQPWAFGDTLHIMLSTPFNYDPASGNLLMSVIASGTSAPGGFIFFDTNGFNGGGFNGNTIMGRMYNGAVDHGYGLVTGFSTGGTTVPEPGAISLFALAATALYALKRRRA